jgi:hypothetical protein
MRMAFVAAIAVLAWIAIPGAAAASCETPEAAGAEVAGSSLLGCRDAKAAQRYCRSWLSACKKTVKSAAQCRVKEIKIRRGLDLAECKADEAIVDEKACFDNVKRASKNTKDALKTDKADALQSCEEFDCVPRCLS